MASHNEVYQLFSWILLVGIVALQHVPLVKGDASLINDVCSKTGPNSFYCLDCFNNMQQSKQEDVRGLGGTSIICAHASALQLRQIMLDYSLISTGDFQTAAQNCVPKLDLASTNLVSSLLSWRTQVYGDTMKQLLTALDDFMGCARGLNFRSFPDRLVHELIVLRARINLASMVISQISS